MLLGRHRPIESFKQMVAEVREVREGRKQYHKSAEYDSNKDCNRSNSGEMQESS